jgi:hypothetical protein
MFGQAAAAAADFERQYLEYILDALVVKSSIQAPFVLTILGRADFEWWFTKLHTTDPATLRVLMQDQGTSREIISTSAQALASFNGIYANNWAGLASLGAAFPIAVPYVMPASRTYGFRLTDESGSDQHVQIALSGFERIPVRKAS